MPTARGSIEYNGSRLEGTFDVGGSPRYLAVDVKSLSQSFECSNATLTYVKVEELDGNCEWFGTIGRDNLLMKFDGGVSITGQLTKPRSSNHTHGAGMWSASKSLLPEIPTNATQKAARNPSINPFTNINAVRDPAKIAREQQLINLGVPIIACVTTHLRPACR